MTLRAWIKDRMEEGSVAVPVYLCSCEVKRPTLHRRFDCGGELPECKTCGLPCLTDEQQAELGIVEAK